MSSAGWLSSLKLSVRVVQFVIPTTAVLLLLPGWRRPAGCVRPHCVCFIKRCSVLFAESKLGLLLC
jgi:hypothetical protein